MSGRHTELYSPVIGAPGNIAAYGHWGRPFLAFAAERGTAWEYADHGVTGALGGLIDGGRAKLYCVDSFDEASWSKRALPLEERARAHARHEAWIQDQVVPWSREDCGGPREIAAYLNNPMDSLAHAGGDHLDWLRSRLSVLLVGGPGMREDATGALDSRRTLTGLPAEKGTRCELDLPGRDVPHDWPSWEAQLAHHLPRFC